MADDKIVIEIELDDGTVKKGFLKVEKQAKETGKNVGSSLQGGLSSISGAKLTAAFAGVFAVFKGLTGAVGLLSRSIAEASNEVDAVNRLNTSLALTGKFSQQTSLSLQQFASDLQNVTRFGNDATLEVAALIQSLGNLDQQGLQRATKAALDLSSALGIDLNAAATLVGKAAAGEVSSFSRYGLIIKKGADNAETLTNALTALEQKFGGSAEASVRTYSGAVQQLSNTFGDTLEEVGKIVTQSPALIALFSEVSKVLVKTGEAIKNAVGSKDVFKPFILSMIEFSAAVTAVLGPAIEASVRVIDIFINSIKTGFLAIATGLSFLGSVAETVINKVFGTDLTSATENLKANFSALSTSSQETSDVLFNSFSAEKTGQTLDFFAQMYGSVAATNGELMAMGANVVNSVTPQITDSMRGLVIEFKDVSRVAIDVSQTVRQGFANAAAQGINAFVGAIKNGQNALSAFGKATLGVFGDLAIQIGTTLLTAGIGLSALFELSGPKAIVAGLGLIAIGSILKAISGGGSSAAQVGGSVAPGGGTITEPVGTELPETTQQGPTNQVSLIVQGDILDSDGTASRITQLLQDYTDKNGQTVFA